MLIGTLVLLLVVIALLSIPLELEFRVEWPEGKRNHVVLVWALGLLRIEIPTEQVARESAEPNKTPAATKRGSVKGRNIGAALRQKSFRHRIYRFVGDLWASVTKEDMYVHARIGLSDPADTGHMWSVVGPVSGLLANLKNISLAIEPDFIEQTFEIDGSGRLRLTPLKLIAISIRFIASPAIWRGLGAMKES